MHKVTGRFKFQFSFLFSFNFVFSSFFFFFFLNFLPHKRILICKIFNGIKKLECSNVKNCIKCWGTKKNYIRTFKQLIWHISVVGCSIISYPLFWICWWKWKVFASKVYTDWIFRSKHALVFRIDIGHGTPG